MEPMIIGAGEAGIASTKLTTKDYQAAIDVQSACNLGAVVHSFSRVYAGQIAHLASEMDYGDAHTICNEKVGI